jgi:argininosuccinate lyase
MSSISDDDWILMEDIENTEAHDIMLQEQGIIELNELRKILRNLEEIKLKYSNGKSSIPDSFEDVHEFIEHTITKKVGIEIGGKIHTGRSRNDQVATDIRMKVRAELLEVFQGILNLIDTLVKLANRNINTVLILYTHTQQAQIGNFAHYLISHIDHLYRDIERIISCYKRVNLNPLGSSAIGGSSFNLNRTRTTELLGFDGLVENSIDSISTRDFAIEAVSVVAIIMSNLSRMAEDIILWSTNEFGFIEIADEYASTSSVMPQKKNPCSLELIRARTGKVYGNLLELLTIIKGLPTGYNRDLQETKPPLKSSFETVKDSIEILCRVFNTIKINNEIMLNTASESYALALDLADELVRDGLSFREAHKLVGETVRTLAKANKKITEINLELLKRISNKILNKKISITDKKLKDILDPNLSLSKRSTIGSANPIYVKRMLKGRIKKSSIIKNEFMYRRNKINDAKKLLSKTIRSILS